LRASARCPRFVQWDGVGEMRRDRGHTLAPRTMRVTSRMRPNLGTNYPSMLHCRTVPLSKVAGPAMQWRLIRHEVPVLPLPRVPPLCHPRLHPFTNHPTNKMYDRMAVLGMDMRDPGTVWMRDRCDANSANTTPSRSVGVSHGEALHGPTGKRFVAGVVEVVVRRKAGSEGAGTPTV
jgi:hypothetical protein